MKASTTAKSCRGVVLTQRGKQLVGLCPLHPDTEPSLIIDAKKQLWNCLGACHEGGDVYRFVMKADGVDFREAHRRLGGHEAESKSVVVEDQQWLERAVDHYHARLLETPAAQDYLRSRDITATEFVTSFRVGYADGTLGATQSAEVGGISFGWPRRFPLPQSLKPNQSGEKPATAKNTASEDWHQWSTGWSTLYSL